MNETPRPLNLGEILDRTIQLYRSRFLVFFGIAFVPTGVVLTLAAIIFILFALISLGGVSINSNPAVGFMAIMLIVVIVSVALPICLSAAALGSAAINKAVTHPWLSEQITIRDAYKQAWRRGWSYIALFLLEALLVWVVPLAVWIGLVFFGTIMAALAQTAGMGMAAGAIFFMGAIVVISALATYCVWMLLRLSLAFPACVVEGISSTAAIKRSFSLSNGTRGRILLLYTLGTVLNYLLMMAITVPAIFVLALLPGANNPERAQTASMVMLIVIYGTSFAVQALTRPVYGIALMLFYYDQRIRKEGYDIEWMMQQAGMMTPAQQAAVLQQPAELTQAKAEETL